MKKPRIWGRHGFSIVALTAVIGCALPSAASDPSVPEPARMATDDAPDRILVALSILQMGDAEAQRPETLWRATSDEKRNLRRPSVVPTLRADRDEEADTRLLKTLMELRQRDAAQHHADALLAQLLLHQIETSRRLADELAAVREQRDRLQRQLEELLAIEDSIRERAKAHEIALEP
jgi:hypothetical protein